METNRHPESVPSTELRAGSGRLIGVLALQGDVIEHVAAMQDAASTMLSTGCAQAIPVKNRADLARVDGLIVPGGESTTVMKLLHRFQMADPIAQRVRAGMPLWGTCMGMIVIARDVVELEQPSLDLIDISVRRNAFGRQNESAEVELPIPALGDRPFPAIFIRAPWIERMGPGVELLAQRNGHGVMVRQRNVLGTSFHPELSGDRRVHAYFLDMVRNSREYVGKQRSVA